MKISEVAKKYNISQDCLRFYERIGLLPHIDRDETGIRDYKETDLKWLEFIKCMKKAKISTELLIEYASIYHKEDNEEKYEILTELNTEIECQTNELMNYKKKIEKKLETLKKVLNKE